MLAHPQRLRGGHTTLRAFLRRAAQFDFNDVAGVLVAVVFEHCR